MFTSCVESPPRDLTPTVRREGSDRVWWGGQTVLKRTKIVILRTQDPLGHQTRFDPIISGWRGKGRKESDKGPHT